MELPFNQASAELAAGIYVRGEHGICQPSFYAPPPAQVIAERHPCPHRLPVPYFGVEILFVAEQSDFTWT